MGKNKMKKDAVQEKAGKNTNPANGVVLGSPTKRGASLILDA